MRFYIRYRRHERHNDIIVGDIETHYVLFYLPYRLRPTQRVTVCC